jgi:hypothetical protein
MIAPLHRETATNVGVSSDLQSASFVGKCQISV